MNILVTSGKHPPHPVPALVCRFIASIVWAPFFTQVEIASFDTFYVDEYISIMASKVKAASTYMTTADLSIAIKIVSVFFALLAVA